MKSLSTVELTHSVDSPAAILAAAAKLRSAVSEDEISPNEVMTVFEAWAKSLDDRTLDNLPGIPFLRMWLRRGTLEPVVERELGVNGLHGGWTEYGRAKTKAFPLGIVGHWPAGNVEIQPLLSMTCALLGGNAALVRIPRELIVRNGGNAYGAPMYFAEYFDVRPGVLGRSSQYAPCCIAGHRAGDRARLCHRHRPIVAQLAGGASRRGLCRIDPQYSALAANSVLVQRRLEGAAGPAQQPFASGRYTS